MEPGQNRLQLRQRSFELLVDVGLETGDTRERGRLVEQHGYDGWDVGLFGRAQRLQRFRHSLARIAFALHRKNALDLARADEQLYPYAQRHELLAVDQRRHTERPHNCGQFRLEPAGLAEKIVELRVANHALDLRAVASSGPAVAARVEVPIGRERGKCVQLGAQFLAEAFGIQHDVPRLILERLEK